MVDPTPLRMTPAHFPQVELHIRVSPPFDKSMMTLVRCVKIPPFRIAPEVITWGTRSFVRSRDIDHHDARTGDRYIEGVAYHVFDYDQGA